MSSTDSYKGLRKVKTTRYYVKVVMSDCSVLTETRMRFTDKESAKEFVSRMCSVECPTINASWYEETVEEYTYSSPLYDP